MEYDNYDYNYQRYLDWRHEMEEMEEEEIEQEWQRRQCEEQVMNEWNEFIADIDRAQKYADDIVEEEKEEKTMGEIIVENALKQEEEEVEYGMKPCGCSYFDGACDHKPRPHGIDGTQCDCSGCTFDYGYCACGCAGDATKHAEWLEERERNKEFVHETVTADMTVGQVIETVETHGIGKLEEFMKDYMSDKEEEEEEPTSTTTESSFLRDERFWEDLKIAVATGLIAVFFGMYLGRYTCC